MGKYIWIYFCLFATKTLFTSAVPMGPYLVTGSQGCWPKCGKAGSCPAICGVKGYCCKKGKPSCPSRLADLNTYAGFACIRDPEGPPTTAAPTEPYLVPDSKGCWPKCGKKAGSCPGVCGTGGHCCLKGKGGCPAYIADLATLSGYACVRVPAGYSPPTKAPPTGPYLVPNSKGCWGKCGSKAGSCPSNCGVGGYCCRKGKTNCPTNLADVSTSDGYSCVRDPSEAVPTEAPTKPYLVPNSKWCWNKCGSKGGSCPTICGKGGYCCKKGANTCPADLADLNTLGVYACIRVPAAIARFEQCTRDYTKKGCFHQSFITEERLLISDRNFNGTELEWQHFGPSIHSLACRCSAAARSNGFTFFSIRFWAECWGKTVTKVQVTKLSDPALKRKECSNQNFELCVDKDPAECVGKAWYDYLYQI